MPILFYFSAPATYVPVFTDSFTFYCFKILHNQSYFLILRKYQKFDSS